MKNKTLFIIFILITSFLFTNGINAAPLPDTYARLEYLEASGTQYINTNITPAPQTDSIEIKFEITNVTPSQMILATTTGTSNNYEWWYSYSSTNKFSIYMRGDSSTSQQRFDVYEPRDTNIHIMKRDKYDVYLDGSLVRTITSMPASLGTAKYLLFGYTGFLTRGRIYYAEFWKNGTLENQLVPARRKSDNVLGMYDKIQGNFFTNAGTGNFTGGPEIPDTGIDLNPAYLSIIVLSICLIYVIVKNKKENVQAIT